MKNKTNEEIICRDGRCFPREPGPVAIRRLIGDGSLGDRIEEELLKQMIGEL